MKEPIVIDAKYVEVKTKEAARRERKEKFEQFKKQAAEFVENHWQEILVVSVPAACGAARSIFKYAKKRHDDSVEFKMRELQVYDTSLGHYWELKRKLTSNEWVQIEMRRQRGEKLANILADMKVLK